MNNLNAQNAASSSSVQSDRQPPETMSRVDPQKVIAWLDDDRLLLRDRTRHGLHRTVIARKDGQPNAELWVQAVSIRDKIERKRITHWFVQQGEFGVLWITWKEKT